MNPSALGVALALAATLYCASGAPIPASRPFAVEVVDDATGRGVPLVELRTVNAIRYLTDSGGIAAIDEPGLEGQRVFFFITSPGYERPADGFGYRGVTLPVEPGTTAQVKLHRTNLAERLYRITGEGIYRDSILAGRRAPIAKPLLNAQVLGSDSAQTVVYRGRLFWLWGDTNRPSYPLGNFQTSGATSALPGKGGLDPAQGVDLSYFTDPGGFVRGMAPVPGPGPTWLDGLVVLNDGGRERLFAAYSKIQPPLAVYERGLVRFDDERGRFEQVETFRRDAPLYPYGHPFKRRQDGAEYIYFGDPFPVVRVRADAAALRDLSQYEAYTPLKAGSRRDRPELDRDAAGRIRYAWRRNTPTLTSEREEEWIRAGRLRRDEARWQLTDPRTSRPVVIHRGTVRWNAYRRRWILIATEIGGTASYLGEVWYAESKEPLGPWLQPRKIVTHDRYSFYNPVQHPEFDQEGGRAIYFEGTYTREFSGNPEATPRYDYNQIMYRLDLEDPHLRLPAP